MKFSGFQKLTLLDFPKRTACTVFTFGCNLRCPFCHNSDLVISSDSKDTICEEEILSYLNKRKGLIDGICITGGEPMLMKDLPDFCKKVRQIGVDIKIDTNGFFPAQLKHIVSSGLCDYVAMDVKNSFDKYSVTAGVKNADVYSVKESIEFLKTSGIDHEFRTTVCKPLHEKSDLVKIAEFLGGNEKYFLQSFIDSGKIIGGGLSSYSKKEMEDMLKEVVKFVPNAQLRGV